MMIDDDKSSNYSQWTASFGSCENFMFAMGVAAESASHPLCNFKSTKCDFKASFLEREDRAGRYEETGFSINGKMTCSHSLQYFFWRTMYCICVFPGKLQSLAGLSAEDKEDHEVMQVLGWIRSTANTTCGGRFSHRLVLMAILRQPSSLTIFLSHHYLYS